MAQNEQAHQPQHDQVQHATHVQQAEQETGGENLGNLFEGLDHVIGVRQHHRFWPPFAPTRKHQRAHLCNTHILLNTHPFTALQTPMKSSSSSRIDSRVAPRRLLRECGCVRHHAHGSALPQPRLVAPTPGVDILPLLTAARYWLQCVLRRRRTRIRRRMRRLWSALVQRARQGRRVCASALAVHQEVVAQVRRRVPQQCRETRRQRPKLMPRCRRRRALVPVPTTAR